MFGPTGNFAAPVAGIGEKRDVTLRSVSRPEREEGKRKEAVLDLRKGGEGKYPFGRREEEIPFYVARRREGSFARNLTQVEREDSRENHSPKKRGEKSTPRHGETGGN